MFVRLRVQIATLEERKTGDSKSEAEEGVVFASQLASAERKLARANAELEEEEKENAENADLDSKGVDLDSKNDDLEVEILKLESELACVEHELGYKEIYDLYNQGLDENMQQYQQIAELEFENEKLAKGSDGDDG